MYTSKGTHRGGLQEALMQFQGDGFTRTFGGQRKKVEKVSFSCKTEFISFKFQMSSGPQAGKEDMVMFAEGQCGLFEPWTWERKGL